jgi:hypothetical protein
MPRGFLPGHVPAVFASAARAHASHICLSELARPNIGGLRDWFDYLANRCRSSFALLRPARGITDWLAPAGQRPDPPEYSSAPG